MSSQYIHGAAQARTHSRQKRFEAMQMWQDLDGEGMRRLTSNATLCKQCVIVGSSAGKSSQVPMNGSSHKDYLHTCSDPWSALTCARACSWRTFCRQASRRLWAAAPAAAAPEHLLPEAQRLLDTIPPDAAEPLCDLHPGLCVAPLPLSRARLQLPRAAHAAACCRHVDDAGVLRIRNGGPWLPDVAEAMPRLWRSVTLELHVSLSTLAGAQLASAFVPACACGPAGSTQAMVAH
jgi:hypothetical protein